MLNTPVGDPKLSHMTALVLRIAPPVPSSLLEPEGRWRPPLSSASHNDVGGALVVAPRLRMNFEKRRKTGKACEIESPAARISWNAGCYVVLGEFDAVG